MITRDQIRTVIDHPVCDSDGNKIGNAKHVYLDDATGEPEWVTVKTGLLGGGESFVPIRAAAMKGDSLEVPYSKDKVKDAPSVDVDADGHLSVAEEHRLYEYYGIDWDTAWKQANQPGADGWAAGGAAGAAGAAGTAGTAGTAGAAGAGGVSGGAGVVGGAAVTGAAAGAVAGAAKKDTSAASTESTEKHGMSEDAVMIRSEERMHVGTERRESGRVRLRKYVVTEEQEQTVPLRHEEVRLEREPITDADRGRGMSGVEIAEAEQEVTLYAERPVTEIETVPVERVRLTTHEVTEQETVHGQVRKEKIEAVTEAETKGGDVDKGKVDKGKTDRAR